MKYYPGSDLPIFSILSLSRRHREGSASLERVLPLGMAQASSTTDLVLPNPHSVVVDDIYNGYDLLYFQISGEYSFSSYLLVNHRL